MRSDRSPDTDPAVELSGVTKTFADGRPVVEDLSLQIAAGEFMTLLGPSGSGKTTTLNMIAGFLRPDRGEVRLAGRDVSGVPVHARQLGMVFQQYSLFPHMNVHENIAFPLKQRGMAKAERTRRVGEALEMVRLSEYGQRKPAELSGGQQQRVALARAVVYRPRVLLMDEPLGALDKSLRQDLQQEIRRLHHDLGLTFVFVTHDQEEALSLSDRIALFNAGRVEQVGTPEELYEDPASPFVADFIGVTNRFRGSSVPTGDGSSRFVCPDGEFQVDSSSAGPGAADLPVSLVVRPERITVLDDAHSSRASNVVVGVVQEVTYLGPTRQTRLVTSSGTSVTVVELTRTPGQRAPGERIVVGWSASDGRVVVDR